MNWRIPVYELEDTDKTKRELSKEMLYYNAIVYICFRKKVNTSTRNEIKRI